ncbi:probable receptor-like serine/threonine-protein kinase At5g57670 isoform X2 [Capsicum annuum]|uniref:probable receptor-like serine/threonine-protein kinase At5g57670 isoform X2 n=1 Tax=Capsicum annuum TaxID=4072 RepID=UPI001FB063A8|nr:probable receptor-like serine/threonine-protein kinase At5g57670 isoform X2 [Capsicum annuum]
MVVSNTNNKSSKILVGISLDVEESKEIISWAIRVLANPNDTIIAQHIVVAEEKSKRFGDQKKLEESKKWQSISKNQTQIRKAKAFVISLMGEFTKTCQDKQVDLEARVGFSSNAGRGLIKEAKSIPADFLLIGGRKNKTCRYPFTIAKYCCERVPDNCSLVVVARKSGQPPPHNIQSNSIRIQENDQTSSRWPKDNNSPSSEKQIITRNSPTTVLNGCEGEENSSSFDENSITKSSILSSSLSSQFKFQQDHQQFKKPPMSPLRRISSFLRSPFDTSSRKKSSRFQNDQENKQQISPLKCFSYEEIASSTNYFHPENLVGQGGYSDVYRGDLEDGRIIAVKRLAKDSNDMNKEKEFLMELGVISHVNHPNTASLVGYCIENGFYLIFKFYPNGTLSSALHGKSNKSLEWPMRYKIALGIARGLHYLHKCCKHRIIHRDIKASNVLLGQDHEPQISDFGLAKWLPNKWTHHAVIPIEGTFGYLAPEYFMHGIVDEKTDIFAFGILLLEIITGRRPVDSSRQNLLLWATPLMEGGKLIELLDPKLEGEFNMDELHKMVLTASYCVRQSSVWRPSTTEVLELLRYGDDSEAARSWRIPKFTSDEVDDYSMVFGYDLPSDLILEDLF